MDEMNALPLMTDQEVVDLVCRLRPSSGIDSPAPNLDVTPADYSRLKKAEQELVDRGYTELSPGCWAYEDNAAVTLTCRS
jgi:hypothetical protein